MDIEERVRKVKRNALNPVRNKKPLKNMTKEELISYVKKLHKRIRYYRGDLEILYLKLCEKTKIDMAKTRAKSRARNKVGRYDPI